MSMLCLLKEQMNRVIKFGVLSLLLGHWAVYVARICVVSSDLTSHFYPCAPGRAVSHLDMTPLVQHQSLALKIENSNSLSNLHVAHKHYCPTGRKPLASYHSLEQLHRFLFVLGTTHVVYSFMAVALAVARLYSWRSWENQAMSITTESSHHSSITCNIQPPQLYV